MRLSSRCRVAAVLSMTVGAAMACGGVVPPPPPSPVLTSTNESPNTAPVLVVQGSVATGEYTYGMELSLAADCTDREEGSLSSVRWYNEDGQSLATGRVLRLMPEPGRYLVLAACGDGAGRTTTVAVTQRFTVVDRWSATDSLPVVLRLPFATNRGGELVPQQPAASFDSSARDSLVRGLLTVNIPARDFRAAGVARRSPFMRSVRGNYAADDAARLAFRSIEAVDSGAFSRRLGEGLAQDAAADVLVFVHGYRTSFDDAVARAARLVAELQYPGALVAFSWPSEAQLAGYRRDQRDARAAGRLLAGFLAELQGASGGRRLSVIAHSMGAEVLASALRTLDAPPDGAPAGPRTNSVVLHDVVLVSPDIAAGEFLAEVLPSLRTRTHRVTVYAASADFALWSSWGSNLERRLGLGGRFTTLVGGVDTIEVPYRATDVIGHNPFLSESFRDDLHGLLVQQLPVDQRSLTAIPRDDGKPHWRIP